MTIKKLTLYILCFVNAINLATDEDFNNENSSDSEVEEDSLINKNDWNTRKWGDIYFLFPLSNPLELITFFSLIRSLCKHRCNLKALTISLKILGAALVNGLIEYKYWFNKKIGISFYTILSPYLICDFNKTFNSSISIDLFWCKKNKNIFESSIVLVKFHTTPIKAEEKTLIYRFSSAFYLLKYEKDRKFYLIYGIFNINWGFLYNCDISSLFDNLLNGFFSIIFGFNIIGVNDYRKKKKRAEKLLLIEELFKRCDGKLWGYC